MLMLGGWLRGEFVFVHQPAEHVAAADVIEIDRLGDRLLVARYQRGERGPLPE
jgi:hypothetical protein